MYQMSQTDQSISVPPPQTSKVIVKPIVKTTKNIYTHIEVVITLSVVNFFVFLVIARYPSGRFLRKLEEQLRTGLPDLPKPLRTNIHLRKP